MSLISKNYYNRDLSWLRFNHRVLQEAADIRNPLYERLKFLAIFSSNLDEFFKVRVSAIRQIKELDKPLRKRLITKPNKLLRSIKKEVDLQQKELGRIFYTEIVPELEKNHIHLLSHKECDNTHQEFLKTYFNNHLQNNNILKVLDEPFVETDALYLVALNTTGDLFWFKIPEQVPRFISLPKSKNKNCILFIDDVLKSNLEEIYQTTFYAIKISRDAALYIENEYSGNLLEKIKAALPNRSAGQVTRVLIDGFMPSALINKLKLALDCNDTDIVKGSVYHNFKDFFQFPNPTKKSFSFKKLPPISNRELQKYTSVLEAIDDKDRLLCFPYESFNDVIRLVKEAATNLSVTKIKITLYRISKDSIIAETLARAAKSGKDVFVFIETKARFDEENNIKWGKALEESGAKVTYSYPGIKIHSKILYIEKKENDVIKSYTYIGTGNFNEKTAKIYTDFGLMTSHKKITSEIVQVFQILEGALILPKTKKLLVSPFSARKKFIKLIHTEIANAEDGNIAYIILKMNSLEDKEMIDLLYKANNAGVKIRLLIRGVCCLVSGVKGQSEHITVTSIVDRFLEHGRVYVFGNNGSEKMYLGSADWMTRNLDHRIEVITPVLDFDVYSKIKTILQLQLDDNVKSRIVDSKQENKYVDTSFNNHESSQHLIYKQLL
ncbi:MAG: polyphosphate kinase 1 [Psychroserpens sp.]|uniref:polyphosphate kinase 1 n=1 Tax=Psychroserpens sp. TaxID=2020870 RepID=UPI0030017019